MDTDTTPSPGPADASGLRALVEHRAAAVERRDVEALLGELDEDVLELPLLPPSATRGRSDTAEALRSWFAAYDDGPHYEVRVLEADTTGGTGALGYVAYAYRVTGTVLGGGSVAMWVRSTLVCRHDGHRWRVVHAHESVPWDAEADRGVLDQPPTDEVVAVPGPPDDEGAAAPDHEFTDGLYGWITHTQLSSSDPEGTRAWAEDVLGWRFGDPVPTPAGPVHLFAFSDTGGGGIGPVAAGEEPGTVASVHVRDTDAAYAAALDAGAETVDEPTTLGLGVRVAAVRAPGGVVIGLSGPTP